MKTKVRGQKSEVSFGVRKLLLLGALCVLAVSMSGCASFSAHEYLVSKNQSAAIKGVGLQGGGAGIGLDLANVSSIQSWQDAGIQALGALVDAGAAWGAYKLYERSQGGSDTPATQLPSQITTGNNSPVQIVTGGNGTTSGSQHNPNITTISGGGRRQ